MNSTLKFFARTFLCLALFIQCSTDKPITVAEKISFPVNEFTIDPNNDTTLFGKQGTRLFIEKETFQFEDGSSVTGPVKMELKEFYRISDILLADLYTRSDDKILETGGMLNLAATSEGKPVALKSGKKIVVHFPKKEDSYKKMDLFYADKSATDSSVANWNVDTVNLVKKTLKLGSYGYEWPEMDDSTGYDFIPKGYVDTGYYWNPIDFYVSAHNFTEETKKEIESSLNKTKSEGLASSFNNYGAECEMMITTQGKIRDPKVNSRISAKAKAELIAFIKNIPILEAGKNKYGKVIERKGFFFISGGNIIPLYKTSEDYVKSFNNKYSKFEKRPIRNMDDAELEYYVFSVGKLGWINCDRFWNEQQTTDLMVDAGKNTKVKMIFKDIDGVLLGKEEDGKYTFSKVPIGREVTIFALQNVNGQLQTAFKETKISSSTVKGLEFKETTLATLKQELEKLN